MDTLDKYNVEEIKNIVLYVISKSPYKDYVFINKILYLVFERQLIDTWTFMFKDIFLVKDKLPYLRILDTILTSDSLPEDEIIKDFKNSIELKDNNLLSHSKADLDYISEYSKGIIDESLTNEKYLDYVRNYMDSIGFDKKSQIDATNIIDNYCCEILNSINEHMLIENDQFYPKWIENLNV